LKFLIPKLKVKDPDVDALDELLESVDLSSYGLQRVMLNQSISLDSSETEFDPQNPNPRGANEQEKDLNPLEKIISTFNEKWFQGWSATPEEQKIKFVNIADSIKSHPDFENKYQNNNDRHNKELAFEKILKDVMLSRRKDELELYKLFAGDQAFKTAWVQSMQQVVAE
jgi:type I restriction enzyme R subunit